MLPPTDHANDDPHIRRLVQITAVAMALAGSAIALSFAIDSVSRPLQTGLNAAIGALGFTLLLLIRAGRQRLARQLMVWCFVVIVTLLSFQNGGLRGPSMVNFPVAIVVCAWALGTRSTLALSGVIWAVLMVLVYCDVRGLVEPPFFDNVTVNIVFYSVIIAVTAAITLTARNSYLARLAESQRMAGNLAESERELREHRVHLEDMVAARTEELAAARAEAERLLQVKGEFLANMSHEIRTPLNGLLGMTQLGLRKHSAEELRQALQHVLETGNLLRGVIDDILDFSKIEAGKLHIDALPVDLHHVLQQAIDLLRERAEGKGLALRLELAADCPRAISGDALRIAQILMNLLSNAIKFTQTGAVVLSAHRDGDTVCLAVRDTGIGMTPEQAQRVFKAFEQADGSTTRQFGGTGLGLTITHRLVELMGGSIAVHSAPGSGSTFTVKLPYVAAELPATAPRAPVSAAVESLQGLRVLIVDDVELNRIILEDLLLEAGAAVEHAENGQHAIDRVEAFGADHFHVILMDVQMPVMDGFAATAALLARYPQLVIIGQTANVMEEDQQRCLQAGMRGTVGKPIDFEELMPLLASYRPANA